MTETVVFSLLMQYSFKIPHIYFTKNKPLVESTQREKQNQRLADKICSSTSRDQQVLVVYHFRSDHSNLVTLAEN